MKLKRKHFRIYKVQKSSGKFHYIVKERFCWVFWMSSCIWEFYTNYLDEYKEFGSKEIAEATIESVLEESKFPIITRED